jgi:hypothetical protein
MPTEVAASRSARPWKASAEHNALWNRIIQSAAEPDFLIVLLFSIIGLILSLFLAVFLNIPQADTLLMMPG